MNRRQWLAAAAVVAGAGIGGAWYARRRAESEVNWMSAGSVGMRKRKFGRTGLEVSEIGFGSWGIGGSYGATDKQNSLDALARAEELGCNFVDSAAVYGDAEVIASGLYMGVTMGSASDSLKTLDVQLTSLN